MNRLSFYLKEFSTNNKTGPIATLKTSMNTCPNTCAWKKDGCYAKYGPVTIHWRKLHDIGVSLIEVCRQIKKLHRGQMLRLFEAGDCPGNGKNHLNKDACLQLAKACRRVVAFGYSHYHPTKHNLPIFQEMSENCTINLSANNLEQADEFVKTGMPVASVVPKDSPPSFYTEGGNRVVVCPFSQVKKNEKGKIVSRKMRNCMNCGTHKKGPMCNWKDRDFIVGFPPHGAGSKYLNAAMNYEFVEIGVMP